MTAALATLRPYQGLGGMLGAVRDCWADGVRRQLVSLPTGTGKTVCFANLPSIGFRRLLIVAHREELLDQAAEKLRHWNPGLSVQVDQAERRADLEAVSMFGPAEGHAVCASVATIGRKGSARLTRYPADYFDAVIIDECFPPGTLVGKIPIEDVIVGDVVPSFDEQTGSIVERIVTRHFVRRASELVSIETASGRLVCTPNHPLLTQRGWIPAGELNDLDYLYVVRFGDEPANEVSEGPLQGYGKGLLLADMQRRMGEPDQLGNDGKNQQALRRRPDAGEESHVAPGLPGEDVGNASNHPPHAYSQGWERDGADRGPGSLGERSQVADGSCRADWGAGGARDGVPEPLQAGRGGASPEGLHRSGRALPWVPQKERGGRSEGLPPVRTRVDRVEVLEPGSDGTFGGLCPGGVVHNLEVEGTHTYLANGFVAHNCHHAAAQSYRSVIEHFQAGEPGGPLLLGVTATPFRADGADLSKVFDKIVYSLDLPAAIEQGYLVDIRAIAVETTIELDGVAATRDDFRAGELADAVNTPGRNAKIVKAYLEKALGRKAVVFCAGVQHSKDLTDAFLSAGIEAEHVDGTTPSEIRAALLARLRSGETEVVCNVGVLTEGFDEPTLECVILARPTKSGVLYAQMLGRGTRLSPDTGKKDLLVIDVADLSSKHTLVNAAALFGIPGGLDLEGQSAVTVRKKVKKLVQMDIPFEELAKAKKVADLDKIANQYRELKMWSPEPSQLVRGVSKLPWISADAHRISLRAGQIRASVSIDLLGRAKMLVIRRGKQTSLGIDEADRILAALEFPSLTEAVVAADTIVNGEATKVFVDPRAAWRRAPASEKQLEILRKKHVPFRPGITKGEASILIDKAFSRRGALA